MAANNALLGLDSAKKSPLVNRNHICRLISLESEKKTHEKHTIITLGFQYPAIAA